MFSSHVWCTTVKLAMNMILVMKGAVIIKCWFWSKSGRHLGRSWSTVDISRTLASRCVPIRLRRLCQYSECLVAAPVCLCLFLCNISGVIFTVNNQQENNSKAFDFHWYKKYKNWARNARVKIVDKVASFCGPQSIYNTHYVTRQCIATYYIYIITQYCYFIILWYLTVFYLPKKILRWSKQCLPAKTIFDRTVFNRVITVFFLSLGKNLPCQPSFVVIFYMFLYHFVSGKTWHL